MLIDVFQHPVDFRFRLIGSECERLMGRNYAGVRFSETRTIGPGNKVWADDERAMTTQSPVVEPLNYIGPDQFVRHLRQGLMPLSADGVIVNMIFNAAEIVRR